MKKILLMLVFSLLSFQAVSASLDWNMAQSTRGVLEDVPGPSNAIAAHYIYTPDTVENSVTFALDVSSTMEIESIVTDSSISDLSVINVSWDGGNSYDFSSIEFVNLWSNNSIVLPANTYYITTTLKQPITALLGQINVQVIGTDVSVVSDISEVPVPSAVWLFGSALLGLVQFSRGRSHQLDV